MSVTRYWMEQGYNMAPGPMPMSVEEGKEVVLATDFDVCAKAAVEMARLVLDYGTHMEKLHAQAVIGQYGGSDHGGI